MEFSALFQIIINIIISITYMILAIVCMHVLRKGIVTTQKNRRKCCDQKNPDTQYHLGG